MAKVTKQLIPCNDQMVKYRILGGDEPDGIAWIRVVPGTASPEEHEAAQKDMDETFERMLAEDG